MRFEACVSDCLDFLRALQDKSVDLIFSDPPYNRGKNYGVSRDNLPPELYERWMQEVIAECDRVSRRGWVFFLSGDLLPKFWAWVPQAHTVIVYKRAAGTVKGNFARQYHALLCTAMPVKRTRDLWDDVRLPGEGFYFREKRHPHPGLTSLELTMRALDHFSRPGELIADPFMGSGTTAEAAMRLTRDFWGCDNNPQYVDMAIARCSMIAATTGETHG